MESTITTATFEKALKKALVSGFQTATVLGMTTEIKEMIIDCEADPTGNDPADWFIVGDILCRASDVWHGDAEIYYLG